MANLVGAWKLEKNEGFDEYMKAMGVNIVLRKVGNSISSSETISQEGDTWTIAIVSTFKNKTLTFKLGEEFDEETMDGRKVKSTITLEDGKLVHFQRAASASEPQTKIVREIIDDKTMAAIFTASEKNVTAKRIFSRQ